MWNYLWIAVGSALGGMARYWCSGIAARLLGETFPWGTLFVNILGSLIIGFFATLTGPAHVSSYRHSRRLYHFLIVELANPESYS